MYVYILAGTKGSTAEVQEALEEGAQLDVVAGCEEDVPQDPRAGRESSLRPHTLVASSLRPHTLVASSLRPHTLVAEGDAAAAASPSATESSLRPHTLVASSLRPHTLVASNLRPHTLVAEGDAAAAAAQLVYEALSC